MRSKKTASEATSNESQYRERFAFIETLSAESIAMTGHGIYVYLNALDIEQLFSCYQRLDTPIRIFARHCVKIAKQHRR